MARIVSFAWTTAALIQGRKTVTRRDWSPDYGRLFKVGAAITAFDRSPRLHGKAVAHLILTHDARYEADADAPDSDYEGEGFAFYAAHPELLPKRDRFAYLDTVSREAFDRWRRRGGSSWVMRFRVVSILVDVPPIAVLPQGVLPL